MSSRRWVVREGDGPNVQAILARLSPSDLTAVDDGRVFLGRRRVFSADETVAVGDTIEIHAPRAKSENEPRILERRQDMVAMEKPAGIATIADHHGARGTLLDLAAKLLGKKASDLHVTSRLDVGVSGVVLIAASRAARDRLALARSEGTYSRLYVAIAVSAPTPDEGEWNVPIGRSSDARYREVHGRDAVEARTLFRTSAVTKNGAAILCLEPETGRTHQLRVHCANAGAPLYGDPVYGKSTRLVTATGAVRSLDRVLLHAHRITVPDARGDEWTVESPVPRVMIDRWVDLGGERASLVPDAIHL